MDLKDYNLVSCDNDVEGRTPVARCLNFNQEGYLPLDHVKKNEENLIPKIGMEFE